MRKITFEEARLKWPTPSMYPKKEWDVVCEDRMNGYNTAVDEAEKEIQEAIELANRSYNEGLMDGRLPIPGLEKEIAELKKKNAELKLFFNVFNAPGSPSQVEPIIKCSIRSSDCVNNDGNGYCKYDETDCDYAKKLPQPESDWHTKHLTAHIDFDERLRKLEASAIMDGDAVIMNQFGKTLKHLIHKIK